MTVGGGQWTVVGAFKEGMHRVASAPAVLAGVFAATFLLALPAALVVREAVTAHLGRSLVAAAAADGVHYDWWQEFSSQASGLSTTLTPSVIGFAATLDNISSVLDGQAEIRPIVWLLAAYLAVWTFLSGGILDRYARQRATRANGFFAAGGVFFFRFLRFAVLAGLVYWFLFGRVHGWLFDDFHPWVTRDLDAERVAAAWRLSLYLVFGALLLLVNLVFDYAKVRAVVEDRRSMVGAVVAAARFVYRHGRQAAGLYLLNAAAFLVLIALWALVAPGAGGAGISMWLGFLIAQAYIVARLFLKLQAIASQTAYFQASLAHARYTAAPDAVWPDSPAAEALATVPASAIQGGLL